MLLANKENMKHIYSNHEGELVVADSLEEAAKHFDIDMGGKDQIQKGWYEIPDDAEVSITDYDGTGKTEVKTAADWAGEYKRPVQISTEYN